MMHIDVVHHNAFLIGAQAQARDRIRVEGFLLVCGYRGGVRQDRAQARNVQPAELDETPNTIALGFRPHPRLKCAKVLLDLLPICVAPSLLAGPTLPLPGARPSPCRVHPILRLLKRVFSFETQALRVVRVDRAFEILDLALLLLVQQFVAVGGRIEYVAVPLQRSRGSLAGC